jgi:uncharacterized protein DUF6671
MNMKLSGHQFFDGRTIIIATMHDKEKVIAPILEKELGVKCATIPGLNTDLFGTFSGEVERKKSPFQTVRNKALAALELSDETLGIASEGSFGPHPSIFFIPSNEEMVMLIDSTNHIEIVGRHLTSKTNFNHREITSLKDLEEFKIDVGYPAHGIILKIMDKSLNKTIHKDLDEPKDLDKQAKIALDNGHTISVETDMRAMRNPTRMLAIEQAVLDLIKNIKSVCPKCNTPGFVIRDAIAGLPCELCHLPTKSAKAYIYQCQKCDYSLERLKEGVHFEEAMYCDFCNP